MYTIKNRIILTVTGIIIVSILSIVIFLFVKNHEVNSNNLVFTQERRESVKTIECYVRNSKLELTNKDIDSLFQILAHMTLKEYISEVELNGYAIGINITEKDGYKYNICIRSKTITVDGHNYYTDSNYISKIENVLK